MRIPTRKHAHLEYVFVVSSILRSILCSPPLVVATTYSSESPLQMASAGAINEDSNEQPEQHTRMKHDPRARECFHQRRRWKSPDICGTAPS